MDASHLDLQGLHFHLGSPIFELQPYKQAISLVLAFASHMHGAGFVMRSFSPGGGFAISYTEQDDPPSIDEYAEAIVSSLKAGCKEFGLQEPELIVEPGRAITGPAGVALYTVGAIKVVPGVRTYVAVDGGMGDNIRPALYDSQYVAIAASRAIDPPVGPVTIAGKYCESGDVLVRDALLPTMEPGDIIAIPASGAYAPSMASTYNLNGRPPIVMASAGQSTLIRRRETYDDLMSEDVI
jgi:diaminopimelate decarboxylase